MEEQEVHDVQIASTVREQYRGGSTTVIVTQEDLEAQEQEKPQVVGTLVLKKHGGKKGGLKWADDVVDNENAGKKKSKVCCIYHKSRKFGESDSEQESTDEDDESDGENSYESRSKRKGAKKHHHDHDHDHENHEHIES